MKQLKERLKEERIKRGQAINKKGYFDSYKDNIFNNEMIDNFQKMFDDGSGGELHSKAEAVHSSSMLSYNFFHWINEEHPFVWDKVEYNKVLFEMKMKTIIGSPAPANMDVVLISKDKKHLLFIESKFLEYTETKSFELSDSYYQDEKRFIQQKDVDWKNLLYDHVPDKRYKPDKCYKYKEGIKQLITHLFGIHGLVCKNYETRSYAKEHCEPLKDVFDSEQVEFKFITLIYEPNKDEFIEEHSAYEEYNGLFKLFVDRIKDEKVRGLQVIPQWVSYSTLWVEMKEQINPKELRAFLWERYMRFAEGTEE